MRLFQVVIVVLVSLAVTSVFGAVTPSSGEPALQVNAIRIGDTLVKLAHPIAFDSASVDDAVGRLMDHYRAQGNFFVRARITGLRQSDESPYWVLDLRLNPGPVVTVRRLIFDGLKRTDGARLRRFFRLKDGSPLTPALLADVESEARTIDYLDLNGPAGIRILPGYTEADLELPFREHRQVSFFGGGGYGPDDNTGLLWNARLTLKNIFGGGRRAGIRSARPDRGRTELTVDYQQPLFWLGRDRGAVSVATRDYRESFYEFAAEAAYTTELTTTTDLTLGLGFKRVEPAGIAAGYSGYSASVGLERSTITDPLNPSGGLRIHTSLTYLARRYSSDSLLTIPGRNAFNETRTTVDIESYTSLPGPAVMHISACYRGLETRDRIPPLAELFFVGGPGSLRGYRTEQFAVQRAAYGTLEPRLRFPAAYLFAFYEGAYLNSTEAEGILSESYRAGVGGGIAVVGEERSVRVSFGWGQGAAFDEPRFAVEFSTDI